MKSVALVNASSDLDGITFDSLAFHAALTYLGYQVRWYQCLDYGQRRLLPPGGRIITGLRLPLAKVGMGLNRLWLFPRALRDTKEEIVFVSDPTLVNVARYHPNVVVRVHDLRPLTSYGDRLLTRWMFHYAIPRLRSAKRIIVPTSCVRRELTSYGIDPDSIRVVPETHSLGIHPEHIDSSIRKIQETGRIRVLCIAADRAYKNIDFVLRIASAVQGLTSKPGFSFTLVSNPRTHTLRRIQRLGLGNLKVVSRVTSIRDIYEAHDVMVFPSSYEGFGRPLIEAMSFGLPILVNKIEAVEEVVGDAGLRLGLDDLASWVEALSSLQNLEVYSTHAKNVLRQSYAYTPAKFRDFIATGFSEL